MTQSSGRLRNTGDFHGARRLPRLLSLLILAVPATATGASSAAEEKYGAAPSALSIVGLVDVHSLDIYNEAAKLHAVVGGRFNGHANPMLAYLASSDGGRNWSAPVFITAESDPPLVSRRGNDAQVAASGPHIVVAWQQRGQFPTGGPLRLAHSADYGHTWSPSVLPDIDDPTNNQSYPDLAADAHGAFHLVWLDDREENGNAQGLRYLNSTDGGRRWSQQATIDGVVCTCCWNRIGILPDQSVSVLYRDDEPHDMRLAVRHRAGVWKDRGSVGDFKWHFAGCPHCGGGFASAMHKNTAQLHSVVWTGIESAPGLYYLKSADLGQSWSSPYRLGDSTSREADIAALSPRHIAVIYSVTTGGNSLIHVRQSKDGGKTWSQAKVLTKKLKSADHPRIVATPFGFRAFWTERSAGGGRTLTMHSLDS